MASVASKAQSGLESTADDIRDHEQYQLGKQMGDRAFDNLDQMGIMGAVRMIGGAMIGIAVLVVVLNEVFSLDSIANSSGPFSDVTDQLKGTGGAALGLLVIGLLVVGANRVMGFFGGGGF